MKYCRMCDASDMAEPIRLGVRTVQDGILENRLAWACKICGFIRFMFPEEAKMFTEGKIGKVKRIRNRA